MTKVLRDAIMFYVRKLCRYEKPFISRPQIIPGDQVEEKKKTDITLPFIRVRDDKEGTYVKVGPIEVVNTKTEEHVHIGTFHVTDGKIEFEHSPGTQLEVIAWAVFFIMIGSVWLIESTYKMELPGVAAVGIGVILLALNYARSKLDIQTSTFTIFVGIVALVYGVLKWFIIELEFWAVIFIAFGVYLVVYFAKRT